MRILITAGGTREYIDPIRFISNASSGKMGNALALVAAGAGHRVTLITTVNPVSCFGDRAASHEARGTVINVETAAQMFEAVKRHFSRCDCLIMAAAVADYTPASPAKTKIKKTNKSLTIKLKPTPDILKWAGNNRKKNQIVVGFALEDKAVRTRAEKKLKEKNLDMIIANTPAAIGADKSTVQMKIAGRKWLRLTRASKTTVAKRIVSLVGSIQKQDL